MKQLIGLRLAITLFFLFFSVTFLYSCKTTDGKTITWKPYAATSTTKTAVTESTNVQVTQGRGNSCEGVVITDTGKDLFRNVYPYMYVAIENNSEFRKEITLDIKWHRQGKTYYGAYDDSVWTVFGPQVLRPGENTKFVVKKAPNKDLTMKEVVVVKCE